MIAPGREGLIGGRPYRHALAAVAIAASLGHSAAAAEIEVLAKGTRFPEGPLWADDALYFVEYGGHTILRVGADDVPDQDLGAPGLRAGRLGPGRRGLPGHLLRREHAGAGLARRRDAAGLRQGCRRGRVRRSQRLRRRRCGRRVHVGVRPVGDGTDRRQDPISRPRRYPADGRRRPALRQWPRPLARRADALLLGDLRLPDRRLRRRRGRQPRPTAASSRASPRSPAAPSRWRPTA